MGWPVQLKLEAAFGSPNPFDASPTWTNISDRLLGVTWGRGRQRQLEACSPGTASLTLDNTDYALAQGNSSSPYSPNVTTGLRVRLTATPDGHSPVQCFEQYVSRIAPEWQVPIDGTVVWDCSDAWGFYFQDWPVITQFASQTLAARMGAVLDLIGFPAAKRSIVAGGTTAPVKTFVNADNATVASVLQMASDSRPGTIFIDGQGRVVHLAQIIRAGGSGGAFQLGVGGIDFSAGAPVLDESGVATYVGVTREPNQTVQGDSPKTQISQTIGTRHGLKSMSRTVWATTDTQAASVASTLLNAFKYPVEMFDPVGISPSSADDINTCLGFEIGQAGRMDRHVDSSTYSSGALLNFLTHTVVPQESWATTLRLTARAIP